VELARRDDQDLAADCVCLVKVPLLKQGERLLQPIA
jgi:hypothetical protein